MNLVQETRDEYFSGYFFSFRTGSSPRMGQIAIMCNYGTGNIKNIVKRLADISVENNYSFSRLEVTLEEN